MIQRIQTIFLTLVVASMATFCFVPHWQKADVETGEVHKMEAFKYTVVDSVGAEPVVYYWPYAVSGMLAMVVIIIAILEIFMYKNRVLQMRLGMINSLFILGSLIAVGWFWYYIGRIVVPHVPVGFELGLILPAIAMVFNRMALRFIKRDEDLVRSVDRIR